MHLARNSSFCKNSDAKKSFYVVKTSFDVSVHAAEAFLGKFNITQKTFFLKIHSACLLKINSRSCETLLLLVQFQVILQGLPNKLKQTSDII